MMGVYCLFIAFDTIVGVREPNYGDVCLWDIGMLSRYIPDGYSTNVVGYDDYGSGI